MPFTCSQSDKEVYIYHEKQKLTITNKWPQYIKLCRIYFIIQLVQVIVDLGVDGNDRHIFLQIIDLGMIIVVFLIDWSFKMLSLGPKFIIVVSVAAIQQIYLTVVLLALKPNILSWDDSIYYVFIIFLDLVITQLQPIVVLKIVGFLTQYIILQNQIVIKSANFSIHLLIFILFIYQITEQEQGFRMLVQSFKTPVQLIQSLQTPVCMVKVQSMEIVNFNQAFKLMLQCEPKYLDELKEYFSTYERFNEPEYLTLYDLFQIVRANGQKWRETQEFVRFQFKIQQIIYDVKIQFALYQGVEECFAIIISDISTIVEMTQITERAIIKSKLIKSLSHELRTRKNIVQGLLRIYLDSNHDSNKDSDIIQQAFNNCRIESNIISSIINYNLCLENQIKLNKYMHKIEKLIKQCIDLFLFEFKLKNIDVQFDTIDLKNKYIYTDLDIFEQIITILLSNAIKYAQNTRQSTITIQVCEDISQSLETSIKPAPYNDETPLMQQNEKNLIIKIIDNGQGINSQRLSQIKQILQNDSLSHTSISSDGFFIGLRSANQLLQKLNQNSTTDVTIDSMEDVCTEITLRFRAIEENRHEQGVSEIRSLIFRPIFQQYCHCESRVMIVDDEPYNNLILSELLKQLGYSSIIANNGQDAVNSYKQQSQNCINPNCRLFKAILMDYQMPIMDGFHATKAILELARLYKRKPVPIIGCTAFSALEDIDRLKSAGMVCVCIKPLTKKSIKDALQIN